MLVGELGVLVHQPGHHHQVTRDDRGVVLRQGAELTAHLTVQLVTGDVGRQRRLRPGAEPSPSSPTGADSGGRVPSFGDPAERAPPAAVRPPGRPPVASPRRPDPGPPRSGRPDAWPPARSGRPPASPCAPGATGRARPASVDRRGRRRRTSRSPTARGATRRRPTTFRATASRARQPPGYASGTAVPSRDGCSAAGSTTGRWCGCATGSSGRSTSSSRPNHRHRGQDDRRHAPLTRNRGSHPRRRTLGTTGPPLARPVPTGPLRPSRGERRRLRNAPGRPEPPATFRPARATAAGAACATGTRRASAVPRRAAAPPLLEGRPAP